MAKGPLVVGMLCGTINQMLTCDLNPEEAHDHITRLI
jgi:hypothetical protein